MTGLVFVHGTGVRRAAYDETTAELRKGLGRIAPDAELHECYWGDVFGVPEGAGLATLPAAVRPAPAAADAAAQAPAERAPAPSGADEDINAWELLYEDPLVPLRRSTDDPADFSRAFDERPPPGFEDQARALVTHPPAELAALMDEADARAEFARAVPAVLDSPTGRDALEHGLPPGELPIAVATALVARLLQGVLGDGRPLRWSTAQRDEAVRIITEALGGGISRGFLDVTWRRVLAPLGGMRYLMAKRKGLMGKAHPGAGDILKYLARGEGLRAHIRQRVSEVAAGHGPVVLVAHSLGGIAAVDLLARHDLPAVRHVVTLGSQAAHLHELGALPCLDPGTHLPRHFPAWTNVYDRCDLLAFLAEPVFPDARVTDVELRSGQPFPASHSAYFRSADVHTLLVRLLRDGDA